MKEPTYYWFAEFKVVERDHDKPDKTIGYILLNRFNRLVPILEEEGLSELDKCREKVLISRVVDLLRNHDDLPDFSVNPTKEQFDELQRDKKFAGEFTSVTVAKRNEDWDERKIGIAGRITMTRYYPSRF